MTDREPVRRAAPRRLGPFDRRLIAVLLGAALLALGCAGQGGPPVAVQGAVDSELGPLLEALGHPQPRVIHGFSFWQGRIGGQSVVVSRTEIGMVHAAMATTILVQEFGPRLIINQGTAGAVNPDLAVGDIVLGKASAPFGAVRTSHRGPGEGMALAGWEPMPRRLRRGDDRVPFQRFESDPDLLALALEVPYGKGRLVAGVVGSADQWNREIDKILWARETWGIDSEDMESAAVHQVARLTGIPFLPVRIISNSEHTDPVFREETGADCARFVVALVEALGRAESRPR